MPKNIDKLFPTKFFNNSPINTFLQTKEQHIYLMERDVDKEVYKNFDELFRIYLSKLPNSHVKKYVSTLFNKNMIYIGTSTNSKNDAIFSRILLHNNKLTGIVLDSSVLDIDVSTGNTTSIDDCIYASYFGLIRASMLANQQNVMRDTNLHKLLSNYVYLLALKFLGQQITHNPKYKTLIHLAVVYMYYRHFLAQKHVSAIATIKRDYKDAFKKEYIDEFLPTLNDLSKYTTMRDLPKVLIDLKLSVDPPNRVMVKMLQLFENVGFYSFIGPFDRFVPMAILSQYPTNLFNKNVLTSEKVHKAVEEKVIKYIDKLHLSPTDAL